MQPAFPRKNLLASLVVGAISATTANNAFAEEKQLEKISVVTSAAGFEQNIADAPASISVVSAEDLQAKQYRDLAEALDDVEGVDVRSSTGKTGGLNISIRGLPSEYTLILIDGRRQNVAGDVTPNGFGEALTSFMPPLSAIERIEVIRGPMSTLYGSDAVGGVVNIITKKVADTWGGSVRLESGLPQSKSWGAQQKTDVYLNGPLIDGKLGLALRGSTMQREASDRILAPGAAATGRNPAPAGSRQYSVGGKLTFTPSSDHAIYLDLDTGNNWYDNADGRLGNRDAEVLEKKTGNLPGYKDYMELNRNQFTLGHNSRLPKGDLDSNISITTTETKGRTIPGSYANLGKPFTGQPSMIIGDDRKLETTNTIADTKYVTSFADNHMTTFGAQYWKAELKDSLIPNTLDQTMVAGFAENEWYLADNLALTLGARYDHHDVFGGEISPRAYLVYNATDNFTVKGGVNKGYRAPKLNDLVDGVSGVTAQGATISIGNPNLKPETSVNTEIGFLYNNYQWFSGSVTLFHNKIEDRISSGGDCTVNYISSCTANNSATYSINIDEAKTWGAELTAKIDLPANFSFAMNYTWTDSEVKEKGEKNGKLGNIPEHLANATLRWSPIEPASFWLKGSYRGEARRFTGDPAKLTGNDKLAYEAAGDIKSYVLFDLGAAYKVNKQVTLNATIANLLDKDFAKFKTYQDTANQTAYTGEYFHTGRSVTGGVITGRTYWLSANITF